MKVKKKSNKGESQDTRERLLKATFKCIYERGIAQLSLRSIAQEVGVNQAVIHYHFKNKDTLLSEFVQHIFGKIFFDLKHVVKETDPPEKKLMDLILASKDFLEKRRKLFLVFVDCWSLAIRNEKMRKAFSEQYNANLDLLMKILDQGKRKGLIGGLDSETLGVFIMGYTAGLAFIHHMSDRPIDLKGNLDTWASTLKIITAEKGSIAKVGD